VDGAVGAHGERGAERVGGLGGADGGGDDLGGGAGLAEPERLLDGDLAEGVHRHLDVGRLHARPVGPHAHLDGVVHHPLHRDQDLHGGGGGSRPLSLSASLSRSVLTGRVEVASWSLSLFLTQQSAVVTNPPILSCDFLVKFESNFKFDPV